MSAHEEYQELRQVILFTLFVKPLIFINKAVRMVQVGCDRKIVACPNDEPAKCWGESKAKSSLGGLNGFFCRAWLGDRPDALVGHLVIDCLSNLVIKVYGIVKY